MALEKTKRSLPCLIHVLIYSVPFIIFMSPSLLAWLVIVGTHFVIDRWRLARYLIWAKNWMAPRGYNKSWKQCSKFGFPPETPEHIAFWIMILVDQVMHITINALALTFL